MRALVVGLIGCVVASTAAMAQSPVTFEGKTITFIVPNTPGGGSDVAGRLIADYLAKLLPGKPSVVVHNMPGADGMVAMNYFAQQTKPDGLTVALGSGSQSDPIQYRKPQSHFDPTKFEFFGGVGRGGSFLLINKAAEPRLYDKSLPPVTMGTLGGVPRSSMAGTVWGIAYLGWNTRWVLGYRGTSELMLALERGEVDMTATGNATLIHRLVDGGRIKILASYESGGVERNDFGSVPLFVNMMEGKFKTPTEQKAFDYYLGMMATDKWVALPPGTPAPIVAAYRDAFAAMSKDPVFVQRGKGMSDEFEPMTYQQIQKLIDGLGSTPPDALKLIDAMYAKQGLLQKKKQ
jgi:tripartite-type tricarboxylate transporter receptor subunit TctC